MHMARGVLRVHLGAAPGVGKTVAMLEEGNRRAGRGTDVVVALVEFHGRRLTRDAVGHLEELPRQSITYRGALFTEGSDQRVLAAFASQAAAALPTQRLVRAVQEAEPLRAADRPARHSCRR
jgi:K+-sensing histidine kinase KdpD